MKKMIFLVILLYAVGQSSCDLLGIGEDKKCGDKQNGYYFRTSHGTGFFTDNTVGQLDRTYYMGSPGVNNSTVIFEKWVQHVCPDKHVKIKASISADIDGNFTVSAKGYWYFFYEEPITLNVSNDGVSRQWEGNGEIGLKQAYGDGGEGEFTIQAYIEFPPQGSMEADSTYLFDKLQNVTLEAEYYDVK